MTITRTPLLTSRTGLVERVECRSLKGSLSREEYSGEFQIAFPYRGAFIWHVGDDAVVSDPNQVLFVRAGEPFRIGAPAAPEFGEVIITPSHAAMRDVCETAGFDLERHPLFIARSCRITPQLQRVTWQFLHQSHQQGFADLQADELLFGVLTGALQLSPPLFAQAPQTRRLIRRAKEFLATNFRARIQLADVASAVGASPAYLTDVFRRFEGVPIYAYLTQLRLGRALLDLPHTEDLTALALVLGFSSHSHFTFAFRRLFGCTPSEFRRSTRRTPRRMDLKLAALR
jgi:AraC-like DNA-binding protein